VATYTALHVQTRDDASVHTALADWLRATHGAKPAIEQTPGLPEDFYRRSRFMASDAEPTRFVVMRRQPEWVTVFFNSFAELDALTALLSTRFKCRVVTILAQSVTDAYFVLIYDSGEHVRTLEWVGETGEWVRQEGRPLGFETSPLGRNISEPGEEPSYVFATEEVQQYCREFGLRIWEGEDTGATEIAMPAEPAQRPAAPRKRWWEFWK
jgi:hypothetical protein